MEQQGLKWDQGKDRWDLLPLGLVLLIVKCDTFGANKYAPNNWAKVENGYQRYKAAMLRHLVAFEKGEVIDPESGLPHLAHMAWNAIAVMYFGLLEHKLTEEIK